MPEHPENQGQMHELLQAYARKRRTDAGDSGELHPATRNALLAEVRDQYPKGPRPVAPPRSRIVLLLPRLAFGLGLLVLVGVGLQIMVRNDQRPPALELARQDAPVPLPAVPAGVKDEREHAPPRADALSPVLTLNPTPSAPSAPDLATQKKLESSFRSYAVTAEKPQTARTERAVGAQTVSPGAGAVRTVLVSFEVEQAGTQLRLIDGDGSVYEGQLAQGGEGSPTPAQKGSEAKLGFTTEPQSVDVLSAARFQTAAGSQTEGGMPNWNFQVRGTNRTLQEPVELQGVLLTSSELTGATTRLRLVQPRPTARRNETPSSPVSSLRFYRASPSAQAAETTNRVPGQLISSTNLSAIQRIQGTLRVGRTNLIQLDAYRDGR